MAEETEQVKTFEDLGLCEALAKACDDLGWKSPTKIQVDSIPPALEGKDVIVVPETGSGRTAAFVLPIIQFLQESLKERRALFACVLSPTKELAIKISEQFKALGSAFDIECAVLVDGKDTEQQAASLGKRPEIVVATPEHLAHHLTNTEGFSLRTLNYLVLDEADRLLNEEFDKSLDEILSSIPLSRQTFLFCATRTEKVREFQRICLKEPVKIGTLMDKYKEVVKLKHRYLSIQAKHKDCYLFYILSEMSGGTTVVFTVTSDPTLLASVLQNCGLKAILINWDMTHEKRLGALSRFEAGEGNILICDDVASTDLDIPVDMVINYEIPAESKDYLRLVARTGRAGRYGVPLSLVDESDGDSFKGIEKLLGKKMEEYPTDEKEVLEHLAKVVKARRTAETQLKDGGT